MTEGVRCLAADFAARLRPLVVDDVEFDLRDVADLPRSADLWVYGQDADVCVSFAEGFDEVRLLINEQVVEPVDSVEALTVVADAVGRRS